MFEGLFNREYKRNHVDSAMDVWEQVYLNDVRAGFAVDLAKASAEAAAEDYMSQYLSFKERGL